jgi:hypothetical protein
MPFAADVQRWRWPAEDAVAWNHTQLRWDGSSRDPRLPPSRFADDPGRTPVRSIRRRHAELYGVGQVSHEGRESGSTQLVAFASKSVGFNSIRETHQLERSWLKPLAFWNMPAMSVTLPVFQLPIGWLNDVAPRNMPACL